MKTTRDYSDWCRQTFALISDGGTWAVPRSGLIFTRRGADLALTTIIGIVRAKDAKADYRAIRREFGKAGITVYDETGVGIPMRAVVIQPDGTATVERIDGSLEGLQALVGGYIKEVGLTCPTPATGYINEEIKGLPRNQRATFVANLMPGDFIAGPMIVLGAPDDEGNDTPIPDDVVGWLGINTNDVPEWASDEH